MSESASPNQLPPVAKSFFSFCKKCDADRYHTVIAHTTATSAKLKCEVCGASSTYSLKAKSSAAKKVGGPKRLVGEALRRSNHNAEYESLMASAAHPEVTYNMKGKFEKNQKVSHPKFGLGVVKESFNDKVEVVFADEVKSLVHNRA